MQKLSFKDFLKVIVFHAAGFLMKLVFSFWPLENKVVFAAYSGLRYSCNPRAISEMLHKMDPSVKQVWLMKQPEADVFPDYIEVVKYGSLAMFRHLLTAKVWVDNGTKSLWVKKRKNQYFIQSWHGGLGFKKMTNEIPSGYGKLDHMRDKHSYAMTDVFISDCRWTTELYQRLLPFYKKEYLECGFPRNDCYYRPEFFETAYREVRHELNLPEETYLVLYAPTYRDDGLSSHYYLDFNRVKTELEKKTGRRVAVLVRLHHWSEKISEGLYAYSRDIQNLTAYPEMPKLVAAADCYISDYSSGIIDFALSRRPAFLYADDYANYQNEERGLYFDMKKLPFPFSETCEELIDNMIHFEEDRYRKKLDDFLKETGVVEKGNASETVCERILDRMKGNTAPAEHRNWTK